MNTQMVGPQSLVVEDVFPHSVAVVWKALTSGELIGRWLMPPSGFEAVAGRRFSFQTTPAGEWNGIIRCEVLDVVANQRLSYSWQGGHEGNVGYGAPLDTVVTFTLAPDGTGTRLRLEHSGFVLPRSEHAFRVMGEGWKTVVARLEQVAESVDEAGAAK